MSKPVDQVSLKLIATRVACELEGLHGRLERLEYGLDMVFVHTDKNMDGQTISMLQELDVLRQSLEALSIYLTNVTQATDQCGLVDPSSAISSVPLKDMAARLGGGMMVLPETGRAELF